MRARIGCCKIVRRYRWIVLRFRKGNSRWCFERKAGRMLRVRSQVCCARVDSAIVRAKRINGCPVPQSGTGRCRGNTISKGKCAQIKAAAILRFGTAESQDESPCWAIHKVKIGVGEDLFARCKAAGRTTWLQTDQECCSR